MEIYKRIEEIFKNPQNIIFFELGFCDGSDTFKIHKILREVNKNFRMYCFEPQVSYFKQVLKSNIYSNIFLYNLAIGKETIKEHIFYKSNQSHYGASSIKAPYDCLRIFPDIRFTNSLCDVITIDDFCTKNKIEQIDFIWADIQGAEADMIKGFQKMRPKIKYLYTEYYEGLYEGSISLEQLLKLLPDFRVIEDYGGDILFKNKLSD